MFAYLAIAATALPASVGTPDAMQAAAGGLPDGGSVLADLAPRPLHLDLRGAVSPLSAAAPVRGVDLLRLDTTEADAVLPTPGSLALLGLAGLLSFRRRRKPTLTTNAPSAADASLVGA